MLAVRDVFAGDLTNFNDELINHNVDANDEDDVLLENNYTNFLRFVAIAHHLQPRPL